jgi:hypothetical protein
MSEIEEVARTQISILIIMLTGFTGLIGLLVHMHFRLEAAITAIRAMP